MTINGYSQPGAEANSLDMGEGNNAVIKIEIDGSEFHDGPTLDRRAAGLRLLDHEGSFITGLAINRSGRAGIEIESGGGHRIVGNFIGTDITGTEGLGDQLYGIDVSDSPDNTIGGGSPDQRNVISGNALNGIAVANGRSTDNTIIGNFIGTGRDGMEAVPNLSSGVLVSVEGPRTDFASENYIGVFDDSVAGEEPIVQRNVISGNGISGVEIFGGSRNEVEANYIGLAADGTTALPNTGSAGVFVGAGGEDNTIRHNVISANLVTGITIRSGATGTAVENNLIGTDASGEFSSDAAGNPLGNLGGGITISEAPENTVGGERDDQGNVISGNIGPGILVTGEKATDNKIQGNIIGLNEAGDRALANTETGILFSEGAKGNFIGPAFGEADLAAGLGNVISGNAGHGIQIQDASLSRIAANFIGTDADGRGDVDGDGEPDLDENGQFLLGNEGIGISIIDAEANAVGWNPDEDATMIGNVISGNLGSGVAIQGTPGEGDNPARGNKLVANRIGTGVDGNTPLANAEHGVVILDAEANVIGEREVLDDSGNPAPLVAGNVISANRKHGVLIQGGGAFENRVVGNLIGTDSEGGCNTDDDPEFDFEGDGSCPLGNGAIGVFVLNASLNTVGGPREPERNIISGNRGAGVQIEARQDGPNPVAAENNFIEGNFIGLDATGSVRLGNDIGVTIANASDNFIGGANESGVSGGLQPGNVITGNREHGIFISGEEASGNQVLGNFVGTNPTGTDTIDGGGTEGDGVRIVQAPQNHIGGPGDGEGNVISGNHNGVYISGNKAGENVLAGNRIGTDLSGQSPVPNQSDGVLIEETSQMLIGGNENHERNLISGNRGNGVHITGFDARKNEVFGNWIGTTADGGATLPNELDGVRIEDASENRVGSPAPGHRNLISGNLDSGVHIVGSLASENRVQANLIGTQIDEAAPLGNELHGVLVVDGFDNLIGGSNEQSGNAIAFNGQLLRLKGHGVVVRSGLPEKSATGNSIRRNSIFENTGRGIALERRAGVRFTLNDLDQVGGAVKYDRDNGPNNRQNYPVVTGVEFDASSNTYESIEWTLHSLPLQPFVIDIYSNSGRDLSGFGEGEEWVHSEIVVTDANGVATLTFEPPSGTDPKTTFFSATATDASGNTSEFSRIDTDGDAIADEWENRGIDLDEDGTPEFQFAGADPLPKDIYVEVDAMLRPPSDPISPGSPFTTQSRLDRVSVGRGLAGISEGFKSVPNDLVQNPDGDDGISLHLQLDETTIPHQQWTGDLDGDGTDALGEDRNANGELDPGEDLNGNGKLDPGDEDDQNGWPYFNRIKSNSTTAPIGGFGTVSERVTPGAVAAKSLVYRYAIVADRQATARSDGGSSVGVSGRAEIGGNDIMITLGAWSTPGGSDEEFAGTFMHELGHSLGLLHGGDQKASNEKPNYHSVMNYTWQYPGAKRTGYNASWRLDYSQDVFPTLDEDNLNESAGIGGDSTHQVPVGPPQTTGFPLFKSKDPRLAPEGGGSVDWNDNGEIDSEPVQADVNRLFSNDPSSPGQTLRGHEDWSNLKYYFRDTVDGIDAGQSSLPDPEMDLETREVFLSIGDGPGTLQFSNVQYLVEESAAEAVVRVTRAGGTDGEVSVELSTADSTAAAGDDYTAVSETLTFEPGEFRKTVTIPLLDDGLNEGDGETVQLTLSNPVGGATLGERSTAELRITDDDGPGEFNFEQSFFETTEGALQIEFDVTRTGGTDGEASVTVDVAGGTATFGEDYTEPFPRSLLFRDGQNSQTIQMAVTPDALVEGAEGAVFALSEPTGGATLGPRSEAVLTIRDGGEGVVEPVLQFGRPVIQVEESAGEAVIEVTRTGGRAGEVDLGGFSVDFTTGDGTAVAGEDYTPVSGTLTFESFETTKTFTVPILDDTFDEETETIEFTLSNPTQGAVLGDSKTAEIEIIDDETAEPGGPGVIQFRVADLQTTEVDGSRLARAEVEVIRTGGSEGLVAAVFQTRDGTAIAGQDYVRTIRRPGIPEPNRGVIFQDGEVSQTVTITIIPDAEEEPPETVNLVLSEPSNTTLGRVTEAELTILDGAGRSLNRSCSSRSRPSRSARPAARRSSR